MENSNKTVQFEVEFRNEAWLEGPLVSLYISGEKFAEWTPDRGLCTSLAGRSTLSSLLAEHSADVYAAAKKHGITILPVIGGSTPLVEDDFEDERV